MFRFLALMMFIAGFAIPAQAAAPTPADQADLKRVEAYLNGLQKFRARILQLNPDGSTIGGTLAIQRPGKMRLDYDAPAKSFIIADGTLVHYWDDTLQQTSSVPQGSSPAALVLKAQVDFSASGKSGMTITDVSRQGGEIDVSMYKTDDKDSGLLTLIFEDAPLRLRQWRIKDNTGATTRVTLQDIDQAVNFERDLFNYRPPSFDKAKKF